MDMSSLPQVLLWKILQFVGSVHQFDPARGRLHWDLRLMMRTAKPGRIMQRTWNTRQPTIVPIIYYRMATWCEVCGEHCNGFYCLNCGRRRCRHR